MRHALEKIGAGIRDFDTTRACYESLWRYPLLLETLLELIHAHDRGDSLDTYYQNFLTMCDLFEPQSRELASHLPDHVEGLVRACPSR